MNARDLLFLEECSLLLMREQLITGPVFMMLRFVMIFVGFESKWELEQLCVLGALAFHTGTFTLLTPDVDTEKALHSCNHAAYRSLHWLKTVFHNVFVLKQCLLTHDDMQGANKMCSIEKSKINRAIKKSRINKAIEKSRVNRAIEKSRINRAIEKSRINRPIVELSKRAGSIGRSLNYREEKDQ
jgi:hypothetical protein